MLDLIDSISTSLYPDHFSGFPLPPDVRACPRCGLIPRVILTWSLYEGIRSAIYCPKCGADTALCEAFIITVQEWNSLPIDYIDPDTSEEEEDDFE